MSSEDTSGHPGQCVILFYYMYFNPPKLGACYGSVSVNSLRCTAPTGMTTYGAVLFALLSESLNTH